MDKESLELVHEILFDLRIDGEPAGTVSCTPQDLEELTAGWLLSEGLIRSAEEIRRIVVAEDKKSANVLMADGDAALRPAGEGPAAEINAGRLTWSRAEVARISELFMEEPPLFARTHAAHSCMIVRYEEAGPAEDGGIRVLYRSEDAGRHSALDKAIGWALLHGVDLRECMLFTSGRISTRMAVKASRAGVSALAGKGTVTQEALEIARAQDMTLIGFAGGDGAVWFHGGPEGSGK